ncbi:hypothetical protein LTR08_008885 [Meristemomyces frigidus]|nr:hypothetical protein LTR08_008885 [Meristemomyces frigidus]
MSPTGSTGDTGLTPITAPWPVRDIVYVAIVGTVMLAALLEWLLWLLAFLYCLVKVYQKADGKGKWSIRVLAILNSIFFVGMRCIFLPIMMVTLPLPSRIVQYFPQLMVSSLQWFAFWAFAGLLIIPWLFCVYQLVTHNIGRTRRIKTVLDEYSAPKVVIIMPCYNEEPEVLLRTVDSIVDCEYPPSCMHIFLSFDGDAENELYLNTIEKLGVPLTLETYPKSIDVTYRGSRVTVSRFPHGGKRSCQKMSYKLIDKVYAEYLRRNDNLFLLFIDSDCILDKVCIQNFMYEMELKPGSKHNMLAMTGVITSTTEKHSLITVLQDMEYIHGQLFERSVESSCGAVTCLPGALTILRFSAFRRMAKYYFADKAEQCDDLFDYGKCHLGEDRWLTHLFMIGAKERYQIQMNTGAFCKTEAVQSFKSLLKQRRRWFLGFITNEVCMLTDARLWRRYPLLLIIRLAQNTIRTTALLFFIMVISIITTSQKIANLPVGFIAVSLGLNWLLMIYFGAKLGRLKVMAYPVMFVVNPFMNWLYMVYGIFTAGQRTWGGPRADAGKADEHTTPTQAIEKGTITGDELNVVPESFKPALEATMMRLPHQMPLLPSGRLEGRFAQAEELPGGWYRQANDSVALFADMTPRETEGMLHGKRFRRDSNDSMQSDVSTMEPGYTPRRVESIFSPEDAVAYLERQEYQRPAGGAHCEEAGSRQMVPAFSNGPLKADPSTASLESWASESSVSMHFGVPHRVPTQPVNGIQPARGGDAPPDVRLPTRAPLTQHQATEGSLAVPPAVHRPSESYLPRSSRTDRSPLARRSFTRVASPVHDEDQNAPMSAAEVIELERVVAARASLEAERRGRQRNDDRRRPRKLSKQRPASTSSRD